MMRMSSLCELLANLSLGDRRQNEQTVLTALHTVFVRYHNYIAKNVLRHHPEYTDEEVYQVSLCLCLCL